MKTVITALAALALFLPAPNATASPDCLYGQVCAPRPPAQWPGQLQPSWEVPPYGGSSGSVICDTIAVSCGPMAVNPNGRR